jgi:hypothetical protein
LQCASACNGPLLATCDRGMALPFYYVGPVADLVGPVPVRRSPTDLVICVLASAPAGPSRPGEVRKESGFE